MTVHAVIGWFGDLEWIEAIYARAEDAEQACEQMWKERRSTHVPDYVQGVCKFAVQDYEVIGSASLAVR